MNASLLKTKRVNCINHWSNVLPLELTDKVPAAEDSGTMSRLAIGKKQKLACPEQKTGVLFTNLDKGPIGRTGEIGRHISGSGIQIQQQNSSSFHAFKHHQYSIFLLHFL